MSGGKWDGMQLAELTGSGEGDRNESRAAFLPAAITYLG